jgi:GH25 family lysozyme M1 (1,4-beta-N-acetylmuramidase)
MRKSRLAALVAALLLTLALPAISQGFDNGRASPADVAPINTGISCPGLGGQLANDAAAGWNTFALRQRSPLAINGCDSAYRPIERQVYWRNYWCGQGACGNAALPGTSNHGIGRAVDVPQSVRGLIDLRGRRFGFSKACSDAAHEWWHVTFCAPFSRPNPGLLLNRPVLKKGSGGPGQRAWVVKVQKLLRRHGARGLKPDGVFGRNTRGLVILFQKAEGLKPDGVVGPVTWRRLRQPVVNDEQSPPPPPTPPTPPRPPDPAVPVPTPPAPREPVYGVDVSQHQGDIDWLRVRRSGYSFAIAKATEGQDFTDPGFGKGRLDAIEQAGLVPGVYHFLRPRPDRPGAREAVWFVQVIANAGYERGFLPPVVDIEQTSLSDRGTCRYLRSFTRRVQEVLHVEPIVYTYPSFAREHLSSCSWLKGHRLWIAHYTAGKPEIPAPWSRYLMHQFSDRGQVDGIAGGVDVNRLPGGRRRLRSLRVDEEPKRNQRRLSIPAETPIDDPTLHELRQLVPAADELPLDEVAVPEGDRHSVPAGG